VLTTSVEQGRKGHKGAVLCLCHAHAHAHAHGGDGGTWVAMMPLRLMAALLTVMTSS